MITSKGNQIITKYMLGQAPEYAAYIAVGTGATPRLVGSAETALPTKKSLDFEAFRVPVTSRGIVNDTIALDIDAWNSASNVVTITTATTHGITVGDEVDIAFSNPAYAARNRTNVVVTKTEASNKFSYNQTIANGSWATGADTATVTYSKDRIIFKAQLPPDQQYRMTEVAVYPAANNQLALGYDSRSIVGFLPTEGWYYHNVTDNAIEFITAPLSASAANSPLYENLVGGSAIFVNSDNIIFDSSIRAARQEPPRYLNRSLIVRGDMTAFTSDSMAIPATPKYVTTTSALSLNFSKNSPNDYIKLAVSALGVSASASVAPTKMRIMLRFIDNVGGGVATMTHILTNTQFNVSRYQIISKQIKDFTITGSFNWSRIGAIEVYGQTVNGGGTWDGSYIIFDGLRIDNENTPNPLYGMVCYSTLQNSYNDGIPLDKVENSQGYIEYRLGVSIF